MSPEKNFPEQRSTELAGHAAELLQINNVEIPAQRGRTRTEHERDMIARAVSKNILQLDEELAAELGIDER